MTGHSEKEITQELGLSVGAAFKKFGVRSWAELMALWL